MGWAEGRPIGKAFWKTQKTPLVVVPNAPPKGLLLETAKKQGFFGNPKGFFGKPKGYWTTPKGFLKGRATSNPNLTFGLTLSFPKPLRGFGKERVSPI